MGTSQAVRLKRRVATAASPNFKHWSTCRHCGILVTHTGQVSRASGALPRPYQGVLVA